MVSSKLRECVDITHNGTICMGKSLICDGFEPNYHAAAFTHAHSDHIGHFESCMHRYNVYVSKITSDLLSALTGDKYHIHTQFHPINYDDKRMIKFNGRGDLLSLRESSHMLGASQISLLTHDKIRIHYSGDISPSDAPPRCDVLVMDSSRGAPRFNRTIEPESLERRLVDLAVGLVDRGKPVCVHAHRGKLQSTMHALSLSDKIPKDVPFLASQKEINMAAVYKKYGMTIRELQNNSGYDADEIKESGYPWIEFVSSFNKSRDEEDGLVERIEFSVTPGQAPMTSRQSFHRIASDEHAELSGLIQYAKQSQADLVVVDNHRSRLGAELAEKIRVDVGVDAIALPTKTRAPDDAP